MPRQARLEGTFVSRGSGGLKILVVDDDPDIVRMVSLFLEAGGHEVVGSDSPFGVSSLVRREGPDVLILDVMMPGLSGDALAALVAAVGARPRIIFYSALPEDQLVELSTKVPGAIWVSKTDGLTLLRSTVERVGRAI